MRIEEVSKKEWSAIWARYDELFKREESKYSHEEQVSRYDEVFDAVVESLSSLGRIEVDGKIAFPNVKKKRLLGRLIPRAQRVPRVKEQVLFSMSRWVDVSRGITVVSKTDITTTIKALDVMGGLLPALDRQFQIVFNLFVRHEEIATCNFYLCVEPSRRCTAYCPSNGVVAKIIPVDMLS